jgi:hypothetical protein
LHAGSAEAAAARKTPGAGGGPPAPSVPAQAPTATTTEPYHPLRDVAAIVEFEVLGMRHDYDSRLGPRLVVSIANPIAHAGLAPAETEFRQFGGPTPDGRFQVVSELPRFSVGARYILFLPALAWFYTPAWAGLAFRVEPFARKTVVLGMGGTPVLGFDCNGVRFGRTRVVEGRFDLATPLAPQTRVASVTEGDPDVAAALTREQFLAAADAAARAAGAKLGAPVTLTPDPTRTWTHVPAAPPSTPSGAATSSGCRWGSIGRTGAGPGSAPRVSAPADGGAP